MEDIEYSESLVEVREVIDRLSIDQYKKIPDEVLQAIDDNKSKYYSWEYDENLKLKDQKISRVALIILAYINDEYLLTEKQKNS